jgi:hypothetical protein
MASLLTLFLTFGQEALSLLVLRKGHQGNAAENDAEQEKKHDEDKYEKNGDDQLGHDAFPF